MLIEIIKSIILGIVEGITEWLPISSTGHMLLIEQFLKLNVSDAFREMFFVVIQLGAILAVVLCFFNKLNPFTSKKTKIQKKETFSLWLKVLIACLPAGIIGVFFDDILDELFYNPLTIAITLIIYGILFLVIENRNANSHSKINDLKGLSYKTAIFIGAFQILSLIPGTSRSGVTILGAILLGTSRYVAAEFTFFLAIPTMLGASALKMLKFGFNYSSTELILLLVGTVTAFIVSIFAIKFLMNYVKKHNFKPFGYYRIALGILVIAYFAISGQLFK